MKTFIAAWLETPSIWNRERFNVKGTSTFCEERKLNFGLAGEICSVNGVNREVTTAFTLETESGVKGFLFHSGVMEERKLVLQLPRQIS